MAKEQPSPVPLVETPEPSITIPSPGPGIVIPTPKDTDILAAINTQFGGPPIAANPKRYDLHTFGKGRFRDSQTGEEFDLKIVPKDEAYMQRTHHLANDLHFREITEKAFRLTMEKV